MYNYVGIYYDVVGIFDSAFAYYSLAVDDAKSNDNPTTLAAAYNNIGLLYWNDAQLTEASEYFFEASHIYDSLGNQRGLANTYSNIALIFEEQRRPQDALKYTRKALRIREIIRDTTNLGRSYSNLGMLLGETGKVDSSIYFQRKALPYFIATNNKYGLSFCYQNFGTDFHLDRKLDSALFYAYKALELRNQIGNRKLIAASESLVGNILYTLSEFEEALTHFTRAEAYYKSINNLLELSKLYNRIANSYDTLGNHQDAFEAMRMGGAIRDSLYAQEKIKALYEAEARFETQAAEKELLKANNTVLKQAQQRQRLWFLVVLILAISILTIVFIYGRIKLVKADKKQELLEQKLQISRDLHDSVGSQLTYINQRLKTVSIDQQNTSTREDLLNFSQKAISDLRSAIWGMSKALTIDDLATKLADVVASAQSNSQRISYTKDISSDAVSSSVAVNLLRIGQEAIQNAVKHSGASEIEVKLVFKGTEFLLEVYDNGSWKSTSNEGYGTLFMEERTRLIGAQLEINKSKNGTMVSVTNRANDLDTKDV